MAHYFDLSHFEEICCKCIEKTLTPKNVCAIFDKMHLLENSLTTKCMEIMECHTLEILADGSLLKMQDLAVKMVLTKNNLCISSEINLLKPMLDWANAQCMISLWEITPANRRKVLKDRIYHIRFPTLSGDAFSQCLSMVEDGFFSQEEISDIMLSIAIGKKYTNTNLNQFSCERRTYRLVVKIDENKCPVFNKSFEVVRTINGKDEMCILGFSTNHKIFEIFDEPTSYKLPFKISGNWIMFVNPLPFKEGVCRFTLKSTEHCKGSTITEALDTNIYMDQGARTAITSLLYKRK